jgi:hypothetical protein
MLSNINYIYIIIINQSNNNLTKDSYIYIYNIRLFIIKK